MRVSPPFFARLNPPVTDPLNVTAFVVAIVKVPEDPVTIPAPLTEESCWLLVERFTVVPADRVSEEFVHRRLSPPSRRSEPEERLTPPVKRLAPDRIRVPVPAPVSPPAPLRTPVIFVLDAPLSVRVLPALVMSPARIRLPLPAVNVSVAPSVSVVLMVWALVELLARPPDPSVISVPLNV